MLKKTITYTNLFTDKEVTEDHFFHISKADLIEMEMSQKGGMQEYIERIIASEDGASIIAMFKRCLGFLTVRRMAIDLSKARKPGTYSIPLKHILSFSPSFAWTQIRLPNL